MSIDHALARLRANAQTYRDLSQELAVRSAAGAGSGWTSTVEVRVDGSGQVLRAAFTGTATSPGRWREDLLSAYQEALRNRQPVSVEAVVPGVVTQPSPTLSGPDHGAAARRAGEAALRAGAKLAARLPDLTVDATVAGIQVEINGSRLLVDASISDEELCLPGDQQEEHLLSAVRIGLAKLDRIVRSQLEEEQ